jgi:3-dehydroquinate synthase
MRRVRVETAVPYDVRIGPGLLAQAASTLPPQARAFVLSDMNVAALHQTKLSGLEAVPAWAAMPGESSKTFAVLEQVLEQMESAGLDRASVLFAFGGGVIGDLGGLAASLYMRGIRYVQLPTTLLSQVDSSVGGKTAINLRAGKNLAGTFHQPTAVLADTEVLATLGDEDYRSGLGEVVKTALIGGDSFLRRIEAGIDPLLRRDAELLADVVEACVRIKAGIVALDPLESGPRKQLNLGHTFAHAIEHAAGFGVVPHGVAVGVGLVLAARANRELRLPATPDLDLRIARLLDQLGMPSNLEALRERYAVQLEPDELVVAMQRDKKNLKGKVRLVVPSSPGLVSVDIEADPRFLTELLARG